MTDEMFDNAYAHSASVFGEAPSPGLADVLERLVPPRASALDLGCGQGRDTHFLLSKGLHVTAIDQSAAGIAVLRRTTDSEAESRLRPIVGNVTHTALWSGEYDLVIATTIVDHLTPTEGRHLLFHSMTCLKPHGVIYICVHTVADPGFTGEGPVSEFAAAIKHYFRPNELLHWLIDKLEILKYEFVTETDYDHGPVHHHGMAYLIGRKQQ